MIALGCEPCKMDNATFYHFNDESSMGDEKRNIDGIIGCHIDDTLEVASK